MLCLMFSCNEKNKNNNLARISQSKFITQDIHIVRERHYINWKPNQIKSRKSNCCLVFHGDFAQLWTNQKCPYYFKTVKTSKRTFDAYWILKSECRNRVDILDNSYGLKSYPKEGVYFAKYTIETDSIINVEYKFPEWISKVNSISKDSLFPKFLYFHE